MKRCSKCKRELPLDAFSKNRTHKDGLANRCKACRAKYRQVCKVKRAERAQKYQQTHKVKIAKRRKKQRQTLRGCLYDCFASLKSRCNDPNNIGYENYGGRGIKCLFKSFGSFYHHITVDLGLTYDGIKGKQIDRINNDGHYEIGNIQFVTRSENNMNSRKSSHQHGQPTSSRFKGVSWDKRRNKWYVRITVSGKTHCSGYFTDEIEAAKAYDTASIRLHGCHGLTNRALGLY